MLDFDAEAFPVVGTEGGGWGSLEISSLYDDIIVFVRYTYDIWEHVINIDGTSYQKGSIPNTGKAYGKVWRFGTTANLHIDNYEGLTVTKTQTGFKTADLKVALRTIAKTGYYYDKRFYWARVRKYTEPEPSVTLRWT